MSRVAQLGHSIWIENLVSVLDRLEEHDVLVIMVTVSLMAIDVHALHWGLVSGFY